MTNANTVAFSRTADAWIAFARRMGEAARESTFTSATRKAFAYTRIQFPRPLEAVLTLRHDGTVIAARRAFESAAGCYRPAFGARR
jgi:hypothetical protein